MNRATQPYHHGDLNQALVTTATECLEAMGVDGLSMRKLADALGVSRTAAYHHFKDKDALLSAIAAQGFSRWLSKVKGIFEDPQHSADEKLKRFIHAYVRHAYEHPQMYELMFGRTLWKQGKATEALKSIAYPTFQYQVSMTKSWQADGLLPADQDPVRLAQVTWGTLHGIARLLIDGIYADSSHVQEMCECAAALFLQNRPTYTV